VEVKNILSQHFSFLYKQALLRNPNDNVLECQKSANEAMKEDVREDISDNNKTINQSLNNARSRPIYVGKFPSQLPSSVSSM